MLNLSSAAIKRTTCKPLCCWSYIHKAFPFTSTHIHTHSLAHLSNVYLYISASSGKLNAKMSSIFERLDLLYMCRFSVLCEIKYVSHVILEIRRTQLSCAAAVGDTYDRDILAVPTRTTLQTNNHFIYIYTCLIHISSTLNMLETLHSCAQTEQ